MRPLPGWEPSGEPALGGFNGGERGTAFIRDRRVFLQFGPCTSLRYLMCIRAVTPPITVGAAGADYFAVSPIKLHPSAALWRRDRQSPPCRGGHRGSISGDPPCSRGGPRHPLTPPSRSPPSP